MRVCVLLIVVVAACGRIDFDPSSSPAASSDAAATGAAGPPGGSSDAGGLGLTCASGGIACGTGDYCSKPVGMCAASGTCTPKPPLSSVCTDIIVCGCDGKMYGTPCDAARAGQSLEAIGACTSAN